MQNSSDGSSRVTAIKIVASTLVIAGMGLWLWQLFSVLPTYLDKPFWHKVSAIANVALVIHLIEGFIAAVLTFRRPSPKLMKPLQAGVYVFFVGTIGLQEIVQANKTSADTKATPTASAELKPQSKA